MVASGHLVEWLRPRVESGIEVKTSGTWLSEAYQEAVGRAVPRKSVAGMKSIDWQAVIRGIEATHPMTGKQVLVDEAQDVPHRLLGAMKHYARNVLAFADPFQRHADEGSTLEQIVEAVKDEHQPWPVFVLEEDFRTTREIQQFAVAAWAPARQSPSRPAPARGPAPRLIRGGFDVAAAEAKRLLDGGHKTVVIASTHADRAAVVRSLQDAGVEYNLGQATDVGKVSPLAFEALRGLEFDAVVLIPPNTRRHTWDRTAADLYVAATRARSVLTVVLTEEPFIELADSLERVSALLEPGANA
ncbi:MAG: hypothetical protein GX616_16635 [Planctomycetes bacterium]|nr:hypothetical protein [Planctomycetota bacterium]